MDTNKVMLTITMPMELNELARVLHGLAECYPMLNYTGGVVTKRMVIIDGAELVLVEAREYGGTTVHV